MTRRDGTVCARLRIGHSYLTHCWLLKGEPQPFCVSCNEALTINHLLTNCAEFADSRRKHYSTNTLEEVLLSGNYAHVLSFLKEITCIRKCKKISNRNKSENVIVNVKIIHVHNM